MKIQVKAKLKILKTLQFVKKASMYEFEDNGIFKEISGITLQRDNREPILRESQGSQSVYHRLKNIKE